MNATWHLFCNEIRDEHNDLFKLIDYDDNKRKEKKISIYQYNAIQHNSFGIGFDSWLLGPGWLGAMLCEVAHFLAIEAD